MAKVLLCLLVLLGLIARAEEKPPGTVDPETIKAAMERLNQKRRAATSPVATRPVAASQPTTQAATPAGSRPRRVVFVVDASGSMMTKLDAVRVQIRAGLQELAERDYFNLVAEQNGGAVPFAKQMTLATPANVQEAAKWIMALEARGGGSFDHALPAGLNLHPDSIWLVSDGDLDAPLETLKAIRKANTARIPINTVFHFAEMAGGRVVTIGVKAGSAPAAIGSAAERLLWQIAEDSGGICLDREGKRILQPPGQPLELKPAPAPTPAPLAPVKGPSIFREK